MRDPYEILQDIRAAAQRKDVQALEALFLELGAAVLLFSELPDQFFDQVVALLQDAAFLEVENSWNLVYFIDGNWGLLTDEQRARLRAVLAAVFDAHRNYMGAFVIGEILGRQYGDEPALNALLKLSQTAKMPALALVPHGLETLARSTADARLRDRAVQRLKELAGSSIEEVRKEAGISLGKVGRPLGPR
jgi:hypothetical protein